ncbi:hypothetical protein PAMP_012688 [Pampus punctatissimus]
MNQPNGLKKCLRCTSCDAAHGLFAQQTCTPTNDAICDVLNEYYCKSLTDTGCSLAEKHTQCAPGQRVKEPGTSRSDTVCDDCQTGFFSQDGVNCTAWTICSETQVKVKEGSQRNDVVCGNGSRNHYCFLAVFFNFFSNPCLGWVQWLVHVLHVKPNLLIILPVLTLFSGLNYRSLTVRKLVNY